MRPSLNTSLKLIVVAILGLSLASVGSVTDATATPKTNPSPTARVPGTTHAHRDARPQSGTGGWYHGEGFSATQKKMLRMAKATFVANSRRKPLDYRTATAKFGKYVSWRREFAAGWLSAHSIVHISKSERSKVLAIAKRNGIKPVTASTPTPMSACKGVSKWVDKGDNLGPWPYYSAYWSYLNSCDTNRMLRAMDAVLAALTGAVAVVGCTTAVLCVPASLFSLAVEAYWQAGPKNAIQYAQEEGNGAIIIHERRWNSYRPDEYEYVAQ